MSTSDDETNGSGPSVQDNSTVLTTPPQEIVQHTNMQVNSPVVPVSLAGIKPPSNLNMKENIIENWKSYKQRWENYTIVANLVAQTV